MSKEFGEQLSIYEKSIESCKKKLDSNPNDPHIWTELAHIYEKVGDIESELNAYRHKFFLEEDSSYLEVAIVLRKMANYKRADRFIQQALEFDSYNKVLWYERGMVLKGAHRLNEAIKAHEKAIELDPTFEDSLIELMSICYKMNEFDKCIKFCKKFIAIGMVDTKKLTTLAFFYNIDGKLKEAEASCRKALEINPKNVVAWAFLGATFLKMSKIPEAEIAVKKALEIDSEFDLAIQLRNEIDKQASTNR